MDDLRKYAQELDTLTSRWFEFRANNQPCSSAELKALVDCVNEIGRHFGVLGGAVGIINRASNRLAHLKYYPDDQYFQNPLFPYPEPEQMQTGQMNAPTAQLKRILESKGVEIGRWINGLFELRRSREALRESNQPPGASSVEPKPLPERPSMVFFDSKSIRDLVGQWLLLLAIVKFISSGANVSSEKALASPLNWINGQKPTFWATEWWGRFKRHTTLLQCIDLVITQEEFRHIAPNSVELMFFDRPSGMARILAEWFGVLTLADISRSLRIPNDQELAARFASGSYVNALQDLHKHHLPIVEYLVLDLLWGSSFNIYHVECPFLKSLTSDSSDLRGRFVAPGVLLLTITTDINKYCTGDQILYQLAPFFLLMRSAFEPMSDTIFYGDIFRKEVVMKEKTLNLLATSHELKDLVGLIPLANGKPFLLRALRDVLLTISLPAAGRVTEDLSGRLLSPAVRAKVSDQQTKALRDCRDYQEWLDRLVLLACQTFVISVLGVQGELPDSEAEWINWADKLTAQFRVSPVFTNKRIPANFDSRCFLSVAIVCSLRNVLKHFILPQIRYPSVSTREIDWQTNFPGFIELNLDDSDPNQSFLLILNSGVQKDPSGGTVAAVDYFLSQVPEIPEAQRFCKNHFIDGKYIMRIALV